MEPSSSVGAVKFPIDTPNCLAGHLQLERRRMQATRSI
jgi:hypothetical protein